MFGGFDFAVVERALPLLWQGMLFTLQLTGLAICGGVLFGTLLALMRLSPIAPLSWFAASYVNFFRSLPLILVIFWFYFLVPKLLGRPIGGFHSVLIAFIMFEAAYYCEIIRAGIQSVTRNQVYAGYALGLTYGQTMRLIILPQAFRNMLPVLLTQSIIMFQDTSLVYVVGLKDFLTTADLIANRDNRPVELFLFAAAVYLVICLTGSIIARRLQRKYAI
ncbi:MAG: ABC transporter permease subunit [Alphaproteobacteria bacterium]|nr:ABC transporter permease subunit [Alphaproteobacteria bacterium]MBM3950874.1 ABC transporter permease subunit [Rhodospirillales bacterium]